MSQDLVNLGPPFKPLAIPECHRIGYRPAVFADIPFLDQMQKLHAGKLGFQYLKAYEKAVTDGNQVIIAEDEGRNKVGFIFGRERYMSQDHVAIVFQLGVVPMRFRHKVGANLLARFMESRTFGIRLVCCYCAQDLPANRFWEAMGFLPIAFRTGSRRTERLHIFWQRRCRRGDTTTGFWFPAVTTGGSIGEDRVVVPLPNGVPWDSPLPILIQDNPGVVRGGNGLPDPVARRQLPATHTGETYVERTERLRRQSKHLRAQVKGHIRVQTASGPQYVPVRDDPAIEPRPERKPVKVRPKVDPAVKAHARELQARWLEEINARGLIEGGRYDPSRLLQATSVDQLRLMLPVQSTAKPSG